MLVLTRKQNEKIRIGDDVTITVVRTKGKSVRIGIEAPSQMRVLRGEIVFDLDEPSTERRPRHDDASAALRGPVNELPRDVSHAGGRSIAQSAAWPRNASDEPERRQASSGWSSERSIGAPLRQMMQARTTD